MLFAHDYNDRRVHIDETHSNQEYYCPYCGALLVTKKGDIRQHHFAHKSLHYCSDSWVGNHFYSYDISPWHNDWQSLFPKENQEVKLALGDTKHRADVMIDKTVIEFQHSIMSPSAFDDRNNFYFNFGNKGIWLFDLTDLLDEGKLTYSKCEDGIEFNWTNPKRAFNNYDIQSGCIDIFLQLGNDEDCIVRVMDVSPEWFEKFVTTDFMSKTDFLEYVGLKDGKCSLPCRDDIENNEKYQEFKKKYNIILNNQQERAMLAVEGSVLLLAVPGSGKTTVLVSRLGHMVLNKGIAPESILAITYTKQAAEEMCDRFSKQFGAEIGKRIQFSTINSLAQNIYWNYCRKKHIVAKTIIPEKERKALIGRIYKKHNDEYASESDIQSLITAIECIKNMMLSENQIVELEQVIPHLDSMYKDYQQQLNDKSQMDFDDQMVFALEILNSDNDILTSLRNKYKYISVDEAQDTSKIQHAIIKLLAEGNNLFMVGDEDQSIYGFRGAYPRALLNFRYDYKNPYILRMERNYRSTSQIVDKAQKFITKNKGRYEKSMSSERGEGAEVQLIEVDTKEEQYNHLLNVAKTANRDTVFLYRDNESAVVLIDLFTRNNIPFQHRKAEMNFFGNKVVKDIVAYLTLTVDVYDANAFEQICNHGIIYLKNQQKKCAINKCKYEHISIFDAVNEQMKYVEYKYRDRSAIFSEIMTRVASASSNEAISILLNEGYGQYIEEEHLDINKVHILQMLAKQEPDIKKFLIRLKELEKIIQTDVSNHSDGKVVLSTIHTSKGLEYDTVYMVDVFDGRFPSSRPNLLSRAKDNADGEQEERRLFYVGITRAKNNLYLFAINNYPSEYINELFPEFLEAKRRMEAEHHRKMLEEINARKKETIASQTSRRKEAIEIFKEQRRQKEMGSKDQQTVVSFATSTLTYEKYNEHSKYGYNPYSPDSTSAGRSNDLEKRKRSEKSCNEPKALPLDQLSLFSNGKMICCKICGYEGSTNDFWTWQGELGECYNCKK